MLVSLYTKLYMITCVNAEDRGSAEGYDDAFREAEVMMHLEKMRVIHLEKTRVEMLRMLQGTKRKFMQMLEERVKVGEGLLLNKHMVVIP